MPQTSQQAQQRLSIYRGLGSAARESNDGAPGPEPAANLVPVVAAVLLTWALLAVIQVKVARPMLLAERFLPGAGWAEAVALAAYAGFVTQRMLDPRRSALWRRRVWTLFTVVFFGQFALGLAGFDVFLMTGKLHVPVPALIVGGPVFRGEGFFMPILFLSTLVLVGPAWCSHLCYVGAWDNLASAARKRSGALPKWQRFAQPVMLALVVAVALILRAVGASGTVAAALAIAFGLVGVACMVFWSRRLGAMTHCTLFCPMGWLATRVGRRISPFDMRIAPGCDACHACLTQCRFGALTPADIARGRPGPSCTLCGDCVRACKDRVMTYRFLGWEGDLARAVFLVVVVSLHAVFLGVARI